MLYLENLQDKEFWCCQKAFDFIYTDRNKTNSEQAFTLGNVFQNRRKE